MGRNQIDRVYKLSRSKGPARSVLVAIAYHTHDERPTAGAWPAVATLAAEAGYTERTVQTALTCLANMGELAIDVGSGGDANCPAGRRPNRYTITLIPAGDTPPQELHPCSSCVSPPQDMQATPAAHADNPRRSCTQTPRERQSERQGEHQAEQPSLFADVEHVVEANLPVPSPADFQVFWQVYPRKVDRRAALKAWKSAVRRAPVETIIAGAVAYRDDPNREDGYTKNPATWLNADAWDNAPLPRRPQSRYPTQSEAIHNLADYVDQIEQTEQDYAWAQPLAIEA